MSVCAAASYDTIEMFNVDWKADVFAVDNLKLS